MYLGAMAASSGTGFFFGQKATTPGMKGLTWSMLAIASAFLLITLADRALPQVGREKDESHRPQR